MDNYLLQEFLGNFRDVPQHTGACVAAGGLHNGVPHLQPSFLLSLFDDSNCQPVLRGLAKWIAP